MHEGLESGFFEVFLVKKNTKSRGKQANFTLLLIKKFVKFTFLIVGVLSTVNFTTLQLLLDRFSQLHYTSVAVGSFQSTSLHCS